MRSRPRLGARGPLSEARLEDLGSGLAPLDDGWFAVGVREAAWLTNDAFADCCVFETSGPVVRRRPDVETVHFSQVGVKLAVLHPGRPAGLYHAESSQEDFLVLAGECLLLIEGEERLLGPWDFVHCPPGTAHAFVGAGDGPCVVLMVGSRGADRTIDYPVSDLARSHGAGVEQATSSPVEAYAPFPHLQPARPDGEAELPWG